MHEVRVAYQSLKRRGSTNDVPSLGESWRGIGEETGSHLGKMEKNPTSTLGFQLRERNA
jgi:hypothetical protein